MLALGGWLVERGPPRTVGSSLETLRWQDPSTPLRIVQLGDPADDAYSLTMPGEISVDVFPDRRIVARPRLGLPQITTEHFLADQVFPRLVAHLGELVVHAGAVRVGAGAIIFVGRSGRGKSTMSASFDQAGFELIGDDAMIASFSEEEIGVRAVYPSLRLFPDSIDAVMAGADTAGPMAHYSDKQRIDVAGARAEQRAPVPVRAIFSIGEPSGDDQIVIRPLPIASCCMTLVENSFALDPSNLAQARDRLNAASVVAKHAPAFEICYPRNYARLADVRQAILDQFEATESK